MSDLKIQQMWAAFDELINDKENIKPRAIIVPTEFYEEACERCKIAGIDLLHSSMWICCDKMHNVYRLAGALLVELYVLCVDASCDPVLYLKSRLRSRSQMHMMAEYY